MEQQADWWGLQKGLGPRWVMWAPQQWLEQRHFSAWRGASSRISHSKTCQRYVCLLPSSAGQTQMHVSLHCFLFCTYCHLAMVAMKAYCNSA